MRASGPGGQNVNKVATAVQLRYDVGRSTLDGEVRARLRALAGSRMTDEDVLVIDARAHRTQAQNREDARARLVDLSAARWSAPRSRKKTRPGAAAEAAAARHEEAPLRKPNADAASSAATTRGQVCARTRGMPPSNHSLDLTPCRSFRPDPMDQAARSRDDVLGDVARRLVLGRQTLPVPAMNRWFSAGITDGSDTFAPRPPVPPSTARTPPSSPGNRARLAGSASGPSALSPLTAGRSPEVEPVRGRRAEDSFRAQRPPVRGSRPWRPFSPLRRCAPVPQRVTVPSASARYRVCSRIASPSGRAAPAITMHRRASGPRPRSAAPACRRGCGRARRRAHGSIFGCARSARRPPARHRRLLLDGQVRARRPLLRGVCTFVRLSYAGRRRRARPSPSARSLNGLFGPTVSSRSSGPNRGRGRLRETVRCPPAWSASPATAQSAADRDVLLGVCGRVAYDGSAYGDWRRRGDEAPGQKSCRRIEAN